jgi:hypothetical protein
VSNLENTPRLVEAPGFALNHFVMGKVAGVKEYIVFNIYFEGIV